ncbi:MAG: GNAT family N-acyltransferase [Planctomycetota bacterium]
MDTRTGESEGAVRGDGCEIPAAGAYRRAARPEFVEGAYRVRFAGDQADLEAVQRLRYEVFNLELNEGLAESHRLGLDRDRYDVACDHLMVIHAATERLIGTYRMQTHERAHRQLGFYTDQEFALEELPREVLRRSIELGRACLERRHRHGHALFALWRGLAAYAAWTGERYLLGCCSLTSQDPRDGWRMMRRLGAAGRLHPTILVHPRPAVALPAAPADDGAPVHLPRLFASYLRYGAHACGPPAIDRDFGTIDFLVLLDLKRLDPRLRALFFTGLPPGRG